MKFSNFVAELPVKTPPKIFRKIVDETRKEVILLLFTGGKF